MLEIHAFCPLIRQWEVIEDQPLNCSKKLGECKGLIQSDAEEITVKVNISMNGFWYIICQKYVQAEIGKKSSITHTHRRELADSYLQAN